MMNNSNTPYSVHTNDSRQRAPSMRRLSARRSFTRRSRDRQGLPGTFRDPLLLRDDSTTGSSSFFPGAARRAATSPRGDVELMDASSSGGYYSNHPSMMAPQPHAPMYRPPPSLDEAPHRPLDVPTAAVPALLQHPAHSIRAPNASLNDHPARDVAHPLLAHGLCCIQCVRTQELGFTENCGAFQSILQPGLHLLPAWPFATIAGRLSLRIQQAVVVCESCSSDRVFLTLSTSVLYRVAVTRSFEAFYSIPDSNPRSLIQACLLDAIQSIVPGMTLDRLFQSRRETALALSSKLRQRLWEFGYDLLEVLVTKVSPDDTVRQSMDEIAASRAIKMANAHTAEQTKFVRIKQAEGRAERSHLMGVAVAKGRQAIVEGMKESVHLFATVDVRVVQPPTNKEVMNLLLVTQYLDLLSAVQPDAVYQQHPPDAVGKLQEGLA